MIHYRKIIFSLILLTLLSGFASFKEAGTAAGQVKWVLLKGGSLQVTGSTNINKFSCAITGYSSPDTITVYRSQSDQSPVALKGSLALDVKLFDCRNPVMTGDLRKTLKAKDFPSLKIRFINLNRFPSLEQQGDHVKGMVDIELAGVTKRFDVSYSFSRNVRKEIELIGDRDVNFSDFNLTPPRKLGGMIQTENKLSVQFRLNLKAIPAN